VFRFSQHPGRRSPSARLPSPLGCGIIRMCSARCFAALLGFGPAQPTAGIPMFSQVRAATQEPPRNWCCLAAAMTTASWTGVAANQRQSTRAERVFRQGLPSSAGARPRESRVEPWSRQTAGLPLEPPGSRGGQRLWRLPFRRSTSRPKLTMAVKIWSADRVTKRSASARSLATGACRAGGTMRSAALCREPSIDVMPHKEWSSYSAFRLALRHTGSPLLVGTELSAVAPYRIGLLGGIQLPGRLQQAASAQQTFRIALNTGSARSPAGWS